MSDRYIIRIDYTTLGRHKPASIDYPVDESVDMLDPVQRGNEIARRHKETMDIGRVRNFKVIVEKSS